MLCILRYKVSQDSVVGIATCYKLGVRGSNHGGDKIFCIRSAYDPGPNATFSTMGTQTPSWG